MSTSSLRDLGSDLLAALLRVLDRIAGGFTSACAMLGIGMAGCSDAPAAPAPVVATVVEAKPAIAEPVAE